MLEDEKIGTVLAGQPDERVIVILDRTGDLFATRELYADGNLRLDEMLEVPYFFKGLLGRAIPGFSDWS